MTIQINTLHCLLWCTRCFHYWYQGRGEKLKPDHSNGAVLSCKTVRNVVQNGSNFWVHGLNPQVWPVKRKIILVDPDPRWGLRLTLTHSLLIGLQAWWKLFSEYCFSIRVVLFPMMYKCFLTFKSVDDSLGQEVSWKVLRANELWKCLCQCRNINYCFFFTKRSQQIVFDRWVRAN